LNIDTIAVFLKLFQQTLPSILSVLYKLLQLESAEGKVDPQPVKRKRCSMEHSTEEADDEAQSINASKLSAAFQFC